MKLSALRQSFAIALMCLVPTIIGVEAVAAQQTADDLVVEMAEIVQEQDIYGQPITRVQGRLINQGSAAYLNISLTARAFDATGAQVGEGFGVLINACGAGLVFDFAFQPGTSHMYSIPIELFESGAVIDRVEIEVMGEPTSAFEAVAPLADGMILVASEEVVAVEWEDADSFRYGVGCERDLFVNWSWQRYELNSARAVPIDHPYAAQVTEDLRTRLQLEDPFIFENSRLRYAPTFGQRLVYQDRVNTIWTAAADGRFQRQLHTLLNSYSLQGYVWLPQDRFMAYYYGAYGDPVLYFTADSEGRLFSRGPLRSKPSVIVPGVSSDGLRAIIGGSFEGPTGYYIDLLAQNFTELLFEAELPGNNYPPPIPLLNERGDRVTRIYLIRPVEGEARLQCFYRPEEGENVLIDMGPTPLNLSIDERAWMFLSPDERYIALSVNGVHGGLWLIDLQALPPCEA